MKFLSIAPLSVVVFASQSFAAESLDKMASIPDFAFGGIGYAGKTSQGELYFREIYAKADAKSEFGKLLKTGNIQAQCYALVALRKLDPETYTSEKARYSKAQDSVSTIGGCSGVVLPMASVFWNIDKGNYDLYLEKKPKEQGIK